VAPEGSGTVEDVSEEIDSSETTDGVVVETGERERSLAPQEIICGGAMIAKRGSENKHCHYCGHVNHVFDKVWNHDASVTPHVIVTKRRL
jgi:hypothetical protein